MFIRVQITKSKTLQMLLLLDELSNENEEIMIMGRFSVNLINFNYGKTQSSFLDTIFFYSFLSFITTPNLNH